MKKTILLAVIFFSLITQLAKAQVPVLYGLTAYGGNYGNGAIIKTDGNGYGFDTLYSFDRFYGYQPLGSLVEGSNGMLYGMTNLGGANDGGVIFRFNPDSNTYKDLHDFTDSTGVYPHGNLMLASDGKFYGVTFMGGASNFGVIFSFDPTSNTYKKLHDFDGINGQNPAGSLLQIKNKLYGITSAGGNYTYGVIFSYDLNTSVYSKIYTFIGSTGEVSFGSLVQAGNGLLYGMTSAGGAYDYGVVFSSDTLGTYHDIYDFDGALNGNAPQASLIGAGIGKLYGMTQLGGTNGDGILFSINPDSNSFKKLHDFNGVDGNQPHGSLVLGTDGNLYGMTVSGGKDTAGNVFSYNISGNVLTSINSLNDTFGGYPYGDLIQMGTVSGIYQFSANNNHISVYPNPASNQITIINRQSSINEIKITDLAGRVIYNYVSDNLGTRQTIDVSNLPAGMYFITTLCENQISTYKLIVDR